MLKLLIVDDEKMTRDTLFSGIEWESLNITEVKTAKNGLDALAVCEDFTPDICLCDIKMPKMNGIQLGFCLKDRFPQCKTVYLSGYCDKDDLKSAIELGAVSYIEKPISLSEVRDVINKTAAQILIDKQCAESLQKEKELLKRIKAQFSEEELEALINENPERRTLPETNNPTIQKAVEYINDNYADPDLSVSKVADILFMNKSYLCTLFKKETGDTINVYITRSRIEAAQKLISEDRIPIYEVADRVGINDSNYFSTLFKKCTGLSPSEYREAGSK
ncbi:MAG: response regulator [Lachnospiraceae bacterium]|nr:response regulator [Lachnospiraceae bacterium]